MTSLHILRPWTQFMIIAFCLKWEGRWNTQIRVYASPGVLLRCCRLLRVFFWTDFVKSVVFGHWHFCSVSGQLTSRQGFLRMPLAESSLSLCRGTPSVCRPCVQRPRCSLLRIRFLFAQSLRVWQRWEVRSFSDLFLACTSPEYAHSILDSQG